MDLCDSVKEYKCPNDIFKDAESYLDKLIQKHTLTLKSEKIKDHYCKIVNVTCKDYNANRSRATPFMDLIEKELAQSKEMFIIRLHTECQTPVYKSFNSNCVDMNSNVDSLSYMSYNTLTASDTGLVFRRKLSCDPLGYAREKIKEKTGSHEITISNLKKINVQTPIFNLTEQSTLFDFDFKHNWEIVFNDAVQIENVDSFVNISNPEPHYLQPSCILSPMSALSFKSEHGIAGISSSYTYCGLPGASTPMHSEDINFASLNQNIGNGNKVWVSSLFNHSSLMWKMLMDFNSQYDDRKDTCVAHFRKKADFIFLTQLKEWNVGFKIALQRPGDIVVTPTGVPHQVTTTSFTFNEAVNFCDNLWFKVQTNSLPFCKFISKHDGVYGHNYSTLLLTPNFRPQFLEHSWLNFNNLYSNKTIFQPFNYENCKKCSKKTLNLSTTQPLPSVICPVCSQCGKKFKNKYILKIHVDAVHENIKFFCECGKVYSRKSELKAHQQNKKHAAFCQ